MDKARFCEISMQLEVWRLKTFGTEKYMSTLQAAAADLHVSGDEMFAYCKEVITEGLAKQWQAEGRREEERLRSTPIEEVELSVRTYNALKNLGVRTVGDFLAKPDEEWFKARNLGRKCVREAREAINQLRAGVQIRMP